MPRSWPLKSEPHRSTNHEIQADELVGQSALELAQELEPQVIDSHLAYRAHCYKYPHNFPYSIFQSLLSKFSGLGSA